MSECKFCKKNFLNKNTLKYHQKTAKFCIAIQTQLKNDTCQEQSSFNCEYCNKCFNIKHHLTRHYDTCKEKKRIDEEEQADTLKKEIEHLKEQLIIKEKENEIKLNEAIQNLKEESSKKIIELKLLLKTEKEKFIQLDKDNISLKTELKTEIKNKDKQIEEYKKTIDKLHKTHKQEITVMTERLTARSITTTTTNNTIVNSYNGIDISQERFDQHIKDNYTFDLYDKNKEGVKILFLDFLYYNENIKCSVADNSRDKIKIEDICGNYKYVTFTFLHTLCKESKTLAETLKKHSDEYFKRPETNPLFPNQEEVKQRYINFHARELKIMVAVLKAIITSNNENGNPYYYNVRHLTHISEEIDEQEMKNNEDDESDNKNEEPESWTPEYYNISITPPKNKFNRPLDLFSEEADEKAREYRQKFAASTYPLC